MRARRIRPLLIGAVVIGAILGAGIPGYAVQSVVVVVGAPGTDEYRAAFDQWVGQWHDAAKKGNSKLTLIGGDEGAESGNPNAKSEDATDDRTQLKQVLDKHASEADADTLWLVLIGHGSFDGEDAKFNLRGPDVTLKNLAELLAPVKTAVAVIDCTSASAPLLSVAAAPNRIVITATKSGNELNYARFGQCLAAAIASSTADLDKDGQTSLLEAYLTACRGVTEFYESGARLATEHALLDDNGDGLGTPAAWFRGLRATKQAKADASLDGLRAHQLHLVRSERESRLPQHIRERRDELERNIASLRDRKSQLAEDAYYGELEPMLVELAQLYVNADVR